MHIKGYISICKPVNFKLNIYVSKTTKLQSHISKITDKMTTYKESHIFPIITAQI